MALIATRRRNGITKPRLIWPGNARSTGSTNTGVADSAGPICRAGHARGGPSALFARLFFVRLSGSRRPHTFGFAPMGVPACQQDINDAQQHLHESIDKEPAISQHENVTEDYGSHPPNSQY